MTIRKLHSNNVTQNRADIAAQYDELFFDDVANSLLLPDPTGLLESKIGAATTGLKGFASGYVDAGQFVTLDNFKFTVTTGGARGLACATLSGNVVAQISGTIGYVGGGGGMSTNGNWTITPTLSGSFFGWSFPDAGASCTCMINDTTNQRVYRVTMMIGSGYLKNFISIERLY